MLVGFCSTEGWCYSGWWVWDLRTLAQFLGTEISSGLSQDIMDCYKNLYNYPVISWTMGS